MPRRLPPPLVSDGEPFFEAVMPSVPENIPSPDPSLATNERLAHAIGGLRNEVKGWIEALQVLLERDDKNNLKLLEEKIVGGDENIKTRLDGNDTALVAAFKAQTEEAAKQTLNFKEVLSEVKTGIEKQFLSVNGKIDELKKDLSASGGRLQGATHTATLIIAGIAAAAAVVSVAVVLTREAPQHSVLDRQPVSLWEKAIYGWLPGSPDPRK